MRVENRGSSAFKFPWAPCPLHRARGSVFYMKLCGVWPCENLSEGPRVLIVPQCPDEMCLSIVLAAWSWHGQHQSLPAGVLTWLHLLQLPTCCNSGEFGNQKQCYLCTSSACPILQKCPPWHHLLGKGIYLSIWNTHWTGIKSSQCLSPYEASSEALWPCFQMINSPWLLVLVTT